MHHASLLDGMSFFQGRREMGVLEAVLLGAGQRGREVFGAFALNHPHLLRFVAVADPCEERRLAFARQHNIPPELQFVSWEDLLARPQMAPLCINTTMDREHVSSSLAALDAGYHLLLEKPMAHTAEGCVAIQRKAQQSHRIVQICHPLRYTAFYRKVKELVEGGQIGVPFSFLMAENIGYWHFAHSYVRGNWRQTATSGPMILTKACHDMDLAAWLVGKRVRKIISFGERRLFREENAPADAPLRCIEGCPVETSCPFYAPSIYLGQHTEWPVSVISLDSSLEARRRALEEGPYGRCVYRCDNDVVDQQVVIAEFDDGTIVNFTASATSAEPFRSIRVLGSCGELNGHFEKQEVRVDKFVAGVWPPVPRDIFHVVASGSSHGGGDAGVIRNILRLIANNDYETAQLSLQIAVEGHLMAFAAELSRISGQIVDFEAYRHTVLKSLDS